MPAGGHSTLSEPESGRWHPAVLDVVEAADELAYRNSVLFYQSLSRTKGTGRPHQDWAVAFGYDGAKSVSGWLVTDAALLVTIDTRAEAMRRRCRRVVERYGIKELIGGEKKQALACIGLLWLCCTMMVKSSLVRCVVTPARKSVFATTGVRTRNTTHF